MRPGTSTFQPLFEKGFWTTYNQQFATLRHLHSEFSRSDDMLFVEYEIQEGMFTHKGVGTCIESRESEAWLLDSLGRWIHLQAPTCRRSYPVHTHHRYSIHTETLINTTADSLNSFLLGKTIQKIDLQANQPFQYTEPNGFPKLATMRKVHDIEAALYELAVIDYEAAKLAPVAFLPKQKAFLESELAMMRKEMELLGMEREVLEFAGFK
ncbi:MAG: hypothetical protein R2830_11455 [Saprospiraceae bacterium]